MDKQIWKKIIIFGLILFIETSISLQAMSPRRFSLIIHIVLSLGLTMMIYIIPAIITYLKKRVLFLYLVPVISILFVITIVVFELFDISNISGYKVLQYVGQDGNLYYPGFTYFGETGIISNGFRLIVASIIFSIIVFISNKIDQKITNIK